MTNDKREIEKVFKIVSLDDKEPENQFWLTQPVEKRLEALETLRQQYIIWKYGTQQGFQRVYRIVELSQC
jgi:hypothetical protein